MGLAFKTQCQVGLDSVIGDTGIGNQIFEFRLRNRLDP